MTRPIRLRRRVHSETLHLPELREFIGHDVEILVRELPASTEQSDRPLKGSVLRYDEPFEPVVEEDWEASAAGLPR